MPRSKGKFDYPSTVADYLVPRGGRGQMRFTHVPKNSGLAFVS